MKISELIRDLEEVLKEDGDMDVMFEDKDRFEQVRSDNLEVYGKDKGTQMFVISLNYGWWSK